VLPQKSKRVLLSERLAFSCVFSISLIFYTLTLAPTVTLEFSGSMITAADFLGVANSPGYPVWTLLAWLFQWMSGFVTYHGHPNPAWGVNFMSAFFGAASCGLVAWIVSHTSRDSNHRFTVSVIGGISAGLLFAFSPFLWSQSVIADMVTLNVFTGLSFLCLVYLGITRREGRYLYPISFLLGIGNLNSPTFILMIPIYAAACLRLGSWKQWPVLIGLVALGLLPLIDIPLASAQNPPINWGYARTPEGFLHQIARGQYEKLMFSNIFSSLYTHHMFAYGEMLLWQFTTPVLLPAIFSVFLLKRKEMRFWSLMLLLAFFMYTAVLTAGMNPSLDIQTLFIGRVLWIPSYSIMAILIGFGLSVLLEFASGQSRFVFCLACLTAILISFAPLTSNFDPEFVKFFGGSEQSWLGE
jgi:hypothetical protein